ncbi:MAG: DUF1232 domain-containing protein [Microcystis wesenbergii Mw_MB_S_20031200_S109D]|uniref:DUF1232 domain-containing protein n=1 Tax=Microcystis wesenbergii Mw_MB_S_20031200_S109D TaxID=2486241 RepID=A0A552M0X3_9CHRO|nr:MAG: DUF1232 domain-containing protein [Microcystis wesenbergii Mw_MB_S_20031200_S109D]
MFEQLKKWAKKLKHSLYALYLAYHHDGVPIIAKAVAALTVSYALSPIDIIPDFVPIVGYLDDLVLLPLGITLAIRLMPSEIWEECKLQAHDRTLKSLPRSKGAALIIVLIWAATGFGLYRLLS